MFSDNIVYLSRRNLMALLAKLDANVANPGTSACAIVKHRQPQPNAPYQQTMDDIMIVAIDDDEYYGGQNRMAGQMHPREEVQLPKPKIGVWNPNMDREEMSNGVEEE